MTLHLAHVSQIKNSTIRITGSKSETNRLLILQALYPSLQIENISNSDDSNLMQKALTASEELVDIHHAGTAMRFLTAYFSVLKGRTTVLTGSERMQERPVKILVEALRTIGCQMEYVNNEGYPPIKITGKEPNSSEVSLSANVSSQYISAMMLIAPSLKEGLTIRLEGKITSVPYIKMTLSLLEEAGIKGNFKDNIITIPPVTQVPEKKIVVESDWSSASYFYSIAALSSGVVLELSSYKKNSYQGDSVLSEIYRSFSVTTEFRENSIVLTKEKNSELLQEEVNFDLTNSPDIAQTIAVTCFGLNIPCYLTGLHTLKIKETDRLVALKSEIEKLGGNIQITEDSLRLAKRELIKEGVVIETYKDHRMAMAFAPLALTTNLKIEKAGVVSKSYPDFWNDLQKIGFKISQEK
ncbi:3-phosphoshikimate 1-carboxyvinyltransferase [Aquimarina sp. ERC-38]|uniref:3-phosphoshikimate 1-carboxyvinyltransferase n=1 Tax=Aquimarina sp. ERC-38 TaxID=2949996 RepID=UPI0022473FC0|nr:3-phosphoshikimate 1-carboxyvinyltransferase [Aquimarina sp. ERC-38]UZO82488.1 3-phosphoshikimate 1-carboxyvinyltransferase [Aquimarina sp. ERC-38]